MIGIFFQLKTLTVNTMVLVFKTDRLETKRYLENYQKLPIPSIHRLMHPIKSSEHHV